MEGDCPVSFVDVMQGGDFTLNRAITPEDPRALLVGSGSAAQARFERGLPLRSRLPVVLGRLRQRRGSIDDLTWLRGLCESGQITRRDMMFEDDLYRFAQGEGGAHAAWAAWLKGFVGVWA